MLLLSNQRLFSLCEFEYSGLPVMPSSQILNELLEIYFQVIPPAMDIIHQQNFIMDFENYFNYQPPTHLPRMFSLMISNPISPALLCAMFSVVAENHPHFQNNPELIRKLFYERARNMILPEIQNMNLTLLKTSLLLNFFAVKYSIWHHAYFWHGLNCTMVRFLGITRPSTQKSMANPIELEEKRRCLWAVRRMDISGSAASKRTQFLPEYELERVPLPIDSKIFHGPLNNFSSMPCLQQFTMIRGDQVGIDALHVIIDQIFGSITSFRQECEIENNVHDFIANGPINSKAKLILNRLDRFWNLLPPTMLELEKTTNRANNTLEADWIRLLIIYHACYCTLFGPEYNMMSLGQEMINKKTEVPLPPALIQFVRDSTNIDSALNHWQKSPSSYLARVHAERGSNLMVKVLNLNDQRDSPFFGYCCCQIGLVNLIFARQMVVAKLSGLDNSLQFQEFKERGAAAVELLSWHEGKYSASITGRDLLNNIMVELNGGEWTINTMSQKNESNNGIYASQSASDSLPTQIIKKGITNTIGKLLDEPGQCAGTMGMPNPKQFN